jgi:hypothetical protein
MKKQIGIVLVVCSLLIFNPLITQADFSNDIRINVDDKAVVIAPDDQQPFILNGRTYVSLRVVSESLGAKVNWWNSTKQVVIMTTADREPLSVPTCPAVDDKKVQIIIDGKVLEISEKDGQAFITEKSRTVIPLAVVGRALGCIVNWEKETRIVDIKSQSQNIETEKPETDVSLTEVQELLLELAVYKANLKIDGAVINSVDLVQRDLTSFTSAQVEQLKNSLKQLQKYDLEYKLPDGTVGQTAELSIMGEAVANANQLLEWLASERARVKDQFGLPSSSIEQFTYLPALYLNIGAKYGIRGDLAFCQAAKETCFWQFTGQVQPFQNNYCGLWATGTPCTGKESLNGADSAAVRFEPGVHGTIFLTPEIGVEAHIQHLYAYACQEALPAGTILYDPRFNLVARGSASNWQELNARWAVPGVTYGQSIINDYWLKAL